MQTTSLELLPVELPSAPPKQRYYLPQLDVLRFFAFLAVFAGDSLPGGIEFYEERLGLPRAVSAVISAACFSGTFGVDLFFVLSAYLITTLLLREIEVRGQVDVPAFYIRRALRIWPLYFVFLLGYFFLQRYVPHTSDDQPLTGAGLLPFALFVGNFSIVWQPFIQVVHLWSISVEEQFYIVWALTMRWVKVAALPLLACGAIFISLGTRAYLNHATEGQHPGLAFVSILCNTAARFDPMAMGVLLATGTLFAFRFRAPRLWLAGAVAAITGIQMVLPRWEPAFPNAVFSYLLVAVCCAVLVRAALQCKPRNRVLTYLGKISFGLYVYAPIALLFARRWAPARKSDPASYFIAPLLALAMTIVVAVVSFELMEKRFLRLKERFTYVPSRPV